MKVVIKKGSYMPQYTNGRKNPGRYSFEIEGLYYALLIMGIILAPMAIIALVSLI